MSTDLSQLEPQEPNAGMGWISPEGLWFKCDWTGHLELAHDLCEKYYPGKAGIYGPEPVLEKAGWARLCINGFVYRALDGAWPDPMLDTLGKIIVEYVVAGTNLIAIDALQKHWKEINGDYQVGALVAPAEYRIRRLREHPGD